MKNQLLKTASLIFFTLSMFLSACKKEGQTATQLSGTWVRVDTIAVHQRSYKLLYQTELTFLSDRNEFTNELTYVKVDSNFLNPENTGWFKSSGVFSRDGDKIKLTSLKRSHYEKEFPELTGTETGAQTFLDSCSYTIKDNKLILKYTSYPADAPVKTQMVYNRK